MIAFIVRRLLLIVPTTLGVALVVFCLYHIAPGDAASVAAGIGCEMTQGSGGGESKTEQFKREHGLDRSYLVQFLDYIGPINLSRDGHPWFSSPYSERKVEEVELKDGRVIEEGRVMELIHLPSTSDEDRAALDQAERVLADPDAAAAALTAAKSALVERYKAAFPPVLSGLARVAIDPELAPLVLPRYVDVLEALSGTTVSADPERVKTRGAQAVTGAWFAWYYQNGGDRVQNTGAQKWGGLIIGDLGLEMQNRIPVAGELWKRLKVTVPLSFMSVVLAYLIALPLGIFSVRRQGTLLYNVTTVVLFVLYSIPTFWAGLMLVLAFGATGLDWLPVVGLESKDAGELSGIQQAWDYFLHLILPVLTLTYGSLAYLSRQMRASMLEVIRQDYIRTARAKGLSENVVVYKHALRNSMIPILTLLASILPILIGGSVIVESIFSIPGMGKYAFEGLLSRDFNIVMATTIFVGVMTQFGILLSDITYSIVDPRIRHD